MIQDKCCGPCPVPELFLIHILCDYYLCMVITVQIKWILPYADHVIAHNEQFFFFNLFFCGGRGGGGGSCQARQPFDIGDQILIFPPVPRMMAEGRVPQAAVEAVLVRSQGMPDGSQTVRGYDFNNGVDYHKLFRSFSRTGFQATSVGKAIEEIDKMVI